MSTNASSTYDKHVLLTESKLIALDLISFMHDLNDEENYKSRKYSTTPNSKNDKDARQEAERIFCGYNKILKYDEEYLSFIWKPMPHDAINDGRWCPVNALWRLQTKPLNFGLNSKGVPFPKAVGDKYIIIPFDKHKPLEGTNIDLVIPVTRIPPGFERYIKSGLAKKQNRVVNYYNKSSGDYNYPKSA